MPSALADWEVVGKRLDLGMHDHDRSGISYWLVGGICEEQTYDSDIRERFVNQVAYHCCCNLSVG